MQFRPSFQFAVAATAAAIAILASSPALAVWPHDPTVNVPVSLAANSQGDPVLVSDLAGGAIVAWHDSRSGDFDIYALHILASGDRDPLWPVNGRVICTQLHDQLYPQIATDGSGGAIITWRDGRSGVDNDVYAQHVSVSGVVDAAWPAGGRKLCSATGGQTDPRIVSDLAGGALVAWLDTRLPADANIYAQHVLAAGALDVTWPSGGWGVCLSTTSQNSPVLVSDGSGGAIAAWSDKRGGISLDIYAQHILTSGIDPAWLANGRALCTAGGDQLYPTITTDNAGGAIVAWEDARLGLLNADIYAQHIQSTGVVDPGWTANGKALCTAANAQSYPQITSDGSGGAFAVWDDGRVAVQHIYGQHIVASGSIDGFWPADGWGICLHSGWQYEPYITSDGQGGAYATWSDDRAAGANPEDVYAQHILDRQVDPAWPADGRAICTATATQPFAIYGSPLIADGVGGALITWGDGRDATGLGAYDVYIQRVDFQGYLGNPGTLAGFPRSLRAAPISAPALAPLEGMPQQDIVFTDSDQYVQVIRSNGSLLTGWPVHIPHALTGAPAVVGDLDGNAQMEIYVPTADGYVYGLRPDGSSLPGFPVMLGTFAPAYAAMGRISASSSRQLVVGSGQRIFVILPGGAQLGGAFPILLELGAAIAHPPAIGGLTGAQYGDIVVAESGILHSYSPAGAENFSSTLPGGSMVSDAPTMADLDLDGNLEIAVPTTDGRVFVYNRDGNVRPGWPFTDPSGAPIASVAFANLLGTSAPELTFARTDGTIHVLMANGSEAAGWPRTSAFPGTMAPTTVETLNGLAPDVLSASTNQRAEAWNNADSTLAGWPILFNAPLPVPMASGDIDHDGLVDVVALTSGRLYAFEPGSAFKRTDIRGQWPMYGNDAQRAGCLACNGVPYVGGVGGTVSAGDVRFAAARPNPSSGPMHLSFELAERAAARLAIYDVSGREIRMLFSGVGPAGEQTVVWDGKDGRGQRSRSGVYFARLTVELKGGSRSLTQRLALLR